MPGKRKNCENMIKIWLGIEKPFSGLGRPSVASWDSTVIGAWLWFHENTYNDFTVCKTCEKIWQSIQQIPSQQTQDIGLEKHHLYALLATLSHDY